jgi:integrase/recombinase XerD
VRFGTRCGSGPCDHVTDLDEASSTIVVRLKGARDEHRVPITDDFWPLYHRYIEHERGEMRSQGVWVGLRRGRGKPLTYSAFESSLRHIGKKLGANANAHMFRHTVARAVVETSGLKQAQELLGHAHITTTADTYARVDLEAMVRAIEQARSLMDLPQSIRSPIDSTASEGRGYLFAYDQDTIAELDAVADPGPRPERES